MANAPRIRFDTGVTAAATAPLPDADPQPAVKVTGLTKRFGSFVALDGLDLTVPMGAFYAFLGPNGAGKSTTIAVMTGVLPPDGGEAVLLGRDVVKEPLEVKTRLGVVPEELALFERLTARQHLTFCGRMYGLHGDESAARAAELLAMVELTSKADTLIAGYSKGMRRRLAIAAALIHGPQLVFLDEPFEGIDVLASGIIRELLRELSRQGVTLLLTTHVLEIAERLATHAGFIRGGRCIDEGTVGDLCARHEVDRLEHVFERLIQPPASRGVALSFYGDDRTG